MNTAKLNIYWGRTAVQSLYQHGLDSVCISPGSRNTPLTLAFINHPNIECTSHIDERSAAFFALGKAQATGKTVALLCTSGTAMANYFPAIIEATQNRIPLIILSADRPERLLDSGANQTIHQDDLYGKYVRYFQNVGLPIQDSSELISQISDAFHHSMGVDTDGNIMGAKGPVHVNFPFDEPLYDPNVEFPEYKPQNRIQINAKYSESIKFDIPNVQNPLIVCGRLSPHENIEPILKLASHLNTPILADPLSQLRFGNQSDHIITQYDHYIKFLEIKPDVVIRYGMKPVSKNLNLKLDQWKAISVLVDSYGRFNDDCPTIIQTSLSKAVDHFIEKFDSSDGSLLRRLKSTDNQTTEIINNVLNDSELNEGKITQICMDALSDGDQWIIGNSMPIRGVDMFITQQQKDISIFSNRGASGIDGVVSTALGIAHQGSSKKTLLLIGDLSFYHDLNGLLSAKRYEISLIIVVINNNGGGIFSKLPISDSNLKSFNEFWSTPHDLKIEHAAKLYECEYQKIDSVKSLFNALETIQFDGVTILDVIVDNDKNIAINSQISNAIQQL